MGPALRSKEKMCGCVLCRCVKNGIRGRRARACVGLVPAMIPQFGGVPQAPLSAWPAQHTSAGSLPSGTATPSGRPQTSIPETWQPEQLQQRG